MERVGNIMTILEKTVRVPTYATFFDGFNAKSRAIAEEEKFSDLTLLFGRDDTAGDFSHCQQTCVQGTTSRAPEVEEFSLVALQEMANADGGVDEVYS